MKWICSILFLFALPIYSQELTPPTIVAEPHYLGPHRVPSAHSTRVYPGRSTYYIDGYDFRIDISLHTDERTTFIDSLWGVVMVLPDRSVKKFSIEYADQHQLLGAISQYSFYIRVAEGGWITVFLAPVSELRSELKESLYTRTSNRESHFLYIPKELEFD